MPSFDAVSRVDEQELDNAYNQALKEVQTRYDLKNSKSTIEFDKKELCLTLLAEDKMKLQALTEILSQKLAKRGIGLKSLDYKDVENASGGTLRQKIIVKQGISTEDGKEIVKLVKELGAKKVTAQIQQDQVRITGPKRDDLQNVIQHLKSTSKIELQFVNFKE